MVNQCMETHIRSVGQAVIATNAHKTCMSADSKGFNHQRHGICITNWRYILWSCYGQYGVCYGKRA
jgi:hypothetical protein